MELTKLLGDERWTMQTHPMRVDRTTWAPGPWDDEPDKVTWVDPVSKLDCMMIRNDHGSWCGYAGVPEGHPFFGKDCDECLQNPPCDKPYCEHDAATIAQSAHGGLTFSGPCQTGEHAIICHVPRDGRPDTVWWFGFDCAHAWDLSPGLSALLDNVYLETGQIREPRIDEIYRSMPYVAGCVTAMSRELMAF